MAGHLSRAGHQVTVYNRTSAKAKAWLQQYTGQQSATPALCAQAQDIVCICVSEDQDLKAVVLGQQGVLQAMQPGTVLIDHSTVSAEITQEMAAAAAAQGVTWLDAPVSGGQQGAENGQLTTMVGGDASTFAAMQPVLAAYAARIVHMGEVGTGQLAKMVNQICLAGVIQGLAEGLHFAQKANLDVGKSFKCHL